MSAESNMVRPASRQMSTSRVASATSLAPQALKNSSPPPKVPVPRLSAGTLNPEPPSCLYSIGLLPSSSVWPGRLVPPPSSDLRGPFEEGVIGVARGARLVERGGIGLVQRRLQREAAGQVGVGDELHAEGHRVGFTG